MNQINNNNQKQQYYKFEQINKQLIKNKRKFLSSQMIFNYDSSILFQINRGYISAYYFKFGTLKFITDFLAQKKWQRSLYYMEKSNQLVLYTISGSFQVQSIVGLNNNKQNFKLNSLVYTDRMIMNKDESVTIISSQGQINFWHNVNNWKCFQTLICHSMAPIYDLSLNPSENLLISCAYDSCINVLTKQDQQWIIKQIIEVNLHGFRLSFINDNCFVFQPIELTVQVYQYQSCEDIFVKVKEIVIEGDDGHTALSKFQYNAGKDILIKKNGQYINLISGFENVEQLSQSSLLFSSDRISCTLSDTGDYLVLFNNQEHYFIIHKLKQS